MPNFKLIVLLIILFSGFTIPQFADWEKDQSEISNLLINCYAQNDSYQYVGTRDNGIWRSTNKGLNWHQLHHNNPINLDDKKIWSIALSGNNVYAGSEEYFFISTDNGKNWTDIHDPGTHYLAVVSTDNYLFVGLNGLKKGVRYSIDNGVTFNTTAINKTTWSIVFKNNTIFAGTGGNGVYIMSENDFSTAANKPLIQNSIVAVYTLAINGNNIYAGTELFGIHVSTDNGINWNRAPFNNSNTVYELFIINCNVFAGTLGKGICVLNTNGESLGVGFTGPPSNVWSLWTSNNYIFAGIQDNQGPRVIKRKLSNGPYLN